MRYTKRDLLGAIIKWESGNEYLVIESGNNLAIRCVSFGPYYNTIHKKYTLEYLNSCSFIFVKHPISYYEIY